MTGDAMREVIARIVLGCINVGARCQQQGSFIVASPSAPARNVQDVMLDQAMEAITAAPPAARLALARAITPDTHAVVRFEPTHTVKEIAWRAYASSDKPAPYNQIADALRAGIAAARKESDDGR